MTFRVALTFDAEHPDRPSDQGTDRALLATLEHHDVSATFFMQGRWVETYPDVARAMAAGPHLVGNHSFYHARMPLFTGDGFAEDIRAAENVIRDVARADPRPWFRCPFGTGMDDPRLLDRLDALGYRHAGWDVDGLDWDPARPFDRLVQDVVDGVLRTGDGAVVLLHTWPRPTAAAVESIVPRLRDAGVELVRLDALPAALVPTGGPPEDRPSGDPPHDEPNVAEQAGGT